MITEQEAPRPTMAEQLTEVESRLVDAKQQFKKTITTRRSFFLIAACLSVVLGLYHTDRMDFSLWLIVPTWAFAVLFVIAGFGTESGKIFAEVEKLESIKRLYFGFLDVKKDEPYFDRLVKINVENLSEYYSLVKQHTRQSFKLSASVVALGFFLIVIGLVLGFVKPELKDISYLSAAAGIVVNFIGGAVFFLYSRTVLQLKQYHDSLLDVQNILLAFKLVESTAESSERSAMTQRMIEFLSSRRPSSNGT